jgi:hypothetical protein
MGRTASAAAVRRLLLAAILAVSPTLVALEDPPGIDPEPERVGEQSLLDAIARIESSDGAYAADLSEQMLSLGLALQQQERHGEALDVFKRGVHLARINDGLYCAAQIPLLQGEIKSAMALQEYGRVEELQQYLYRVQERNPAGGAERAEALLQQANWQFKAYQLGVGEQAAQRLVTMWDLYRQAWSELSTSAGESSPALLPPLYGLLRTQYLIVEYREENEPSGSAFNTGRAHSAANQFRAYRAKSYDLGRSVILAIYRIQQSNRGADSDEAIQALVSLGDWAQWNGRRDDATSSYQLALAELAARDAAQEEEPQLLVEPVPLPDMNGLKPLPMPVSADQGDILLEFGVDSRGEVVDLDRLDTNEEYDGAASRLMRALRRTIFRPRFQAGEPTGTDKLVRAYEIKP